ncbi:alanine--tRNA ligase [Candidatus Saccharibacteria bacterium RIFCSPHIGHO2_02_FULL_47_12]|nr:MAG: alanine--tRNA ligase [Candidatus Saccharibacteria bacterium RIFCSPHIGHO2_02_FULL_47_12]
MTAQEIRKAYLDFFKDRGHVVVPRAKLVPDNDPTTLFTGSGMQPLLPYLLGEKHPAGKRLTDSQTCFRADDVDEVGDNRHTTFFEMLGNWSLGDYFKAEQLPWFYEFLTEKVGLDPKHLYVTVFIGDEKNKIPKDTESAQIWQKLFSQSEVEAEIVEIGSEVDGYEKGMQNGRIFYYDASKNWWSRVGKPENMPAGEPGGPDSEVFYEFTEVEHDQSFGKHCHPNCDCGRFLEIGNSVFMQYIKTDDGGFKELPQKNVDFGGGLERIAAASINSPDVFRIDLLWPIVEKLQELSGKKYEDHVEAKRIIADHMRSAVFMAADGVTPSNKTQGYILRRLLRRAIRQAHELGIESGLFEAIAPIVVDMYRGPFPEIAKNEKTVIDVLEKEEKLFRQTLKKGLREFEKLRSSGPSLSYPPTEDRTSTHVTIEANLAGETIFLLYDTYGFPPELSVEEATQKHIPVSKKWEEEFNKEMEKQRKRSRTAAAGMFKGGLAEHSEQTIKYHTATHLMYKALRLTLGEHVEQRGSNITNERLRFDFNHPAKMTPVEIEKVESIVNEQIAKDLPVTWKEMPTKEALATGARGHFGEKYGDTVKVYIMGPEDNPYTMELCGGPHVEHTGTLGEGGKKFKIIKEESSAAGIRRIKAVLE